MSKEEEIINLIKEANGEPFEVHFVKRDGSLRKMNASSNFKSSDSFTNLIETQLVTVYDNEAKDYRAFKIGTVIFLKFKDKELSYHEYFI